MISHFSEREEAILKIVGDKKTMTLKKIAERLFEHYGPSGKPFDTEISVGNSVRRIIKKCYHYNLQWTLNKSRIDGKLIITKGKVC